MDCSKLPDRIARFAAELAEAAAAHDVDPLLVAAIVDHESNWDPNALGDNGHGHGLGQIDDRSHGRWCRTSNWKDPLTNLTESARILKQECMAMFRPGELVQAIAAYNAGWSHVRAALIELTKPASPDAILARCNAICTTGRTHQGQPVLYVSDVLRRYNEFRALCADSQGVA